ncbi:hypothetical protein [uncultured Megasphaera sp.]|uniref:hypothetical protein n=1 Tax=uncultured Megasphaera sp. TaxID=165188 RepID=UPI00265A5F9D|nr:hypothetical protein [uncultured Megasphaera sp.]
MKTTHDDTYTGQGNLLQHAKYKKRLAEEKFASEWQSSMESAAHNDRINRFHGKGGNGHAAEQANDLLDTLSGKHAQIVGDNNAKDGADRLVDGMKIQSKYYKSASGSINAAFQNNGKGTYRYIDSNGNPMQVEVPSDQYEEAVRQMEKKIAEGQVPGVTDPKDARKIVRKGRVTYQTACNIAKAGTIDSLLFDAAHGTVIAANAFGISAVIVFAKAQWDGKDVSESIDAAVCAGLQAGGIAFATSVLSAQLTRTALNNAMMAPSIAIVKALPSSVRQTLVNALRNGPSIYGNAATKNLAKLMRSNIIAQAVVLTVLSAGDITNFFRGRISGRQLFKEVTTLASGLGGAAIGGAVGGLLGPVGSIAGAMIGGALSSTQMHKLMDHFIEDDAVALVDIIRKRLIVLAQQYLLTEEELELVVDALKEALVQEKLLEMYASNDREAFADAMLKAGIEETIRWRATIRMPSTELMIQGMGRVLSDGWHDIGEQPKVDAVTVGKRLLGRNVPKKAAKRAWYVTKQMNSISSAQEQSLLEMKQSEEQYARQCQEQQKRLQYYKDECMKHI